jgi:hypothetical protein
MCGAGVSPRDILDGKITAPNEMVKLIKEMTLYARN